VLSRSEQIVEDVMVERDDDGLAGVLNLALINSTALSMNLMSVMRRKGLISADDMRGICDQSASSLEDGLGPERADEVEAKKTLRQHAATLRQFGAISGPSK
jgi:hypothetical protein